MSKKSVGTAEYELLTVQQAAAFLNVGPGTIRRWATHGELHGSKIGLRGDWRFTKDELEALVSPNTSEVQSRQLQHATNFYAHSVQFYDDDAYLVQSVREFIDAGEVGVVIATREHLVLLEEKLSVGGIELSYARVTGVYTSFDAQETLAKFMVRGMLDREKFLSVIGSIIKEAVQTKRKVHAFGEMVAILWQQGNPDAALQVEQLWNELQTIYSFALFCAYPMDAFTGDAQATGFSDVCGTHGKVTPLEKYVQLTSEVDRSREIVYLQQKARSLEAEIEKSHKLEKQKDEFLAVASHELKTPVTSIKAYGEVLQAHFIKEGNDKAAKLLLKMDTQVTKLTRLIEDLLDVTKIQTGNISFTESEFNCDALIQEVVDEIQPASTRHSINTRLKTRILVVADKERFGQVLTNLLSNAIKYSPHANRIIVTSECIDGELVVHVRDFGLGIADEYQKKIFEQFYRVDEEVLKTFSGLGLGLYISQQIVSRMNGQMWVESKPGHGSVFSFSVPQNGSMMLKAENPPVTDIW